MGGNIVGGSVTKKKKLFMVAKKIRGSTYFYWSVWKAETDHFFLGLSHTADNILQCFCYVSLKNKFWHFIQNVSRQIEWNVKLSIREVLQFYVWSHCLYSVLKVCFIIAFLFMQIVVWFEFFSCFSSSVRKLSNEESTALDHMISADLDEAFIKYKKTKMVFQYISNIS